MLTLLCELKVLRGANRTYISPVADYHYPDEQSIQITYLCPLQIQSGVAVESENDFRVDLHCVNPGQTTVRLTMEITDHRYQQAHLDALLQDEVTFEVRKLQVDSIRVFVKLMVRKVSLREKVSV